jgi:hypothetical protein
MPRIFQAQKSSAARGLIGERKLKELESNGDLQ